MLRNQGLENAEADAQIMLETLAAETRLNKALARLSEASTEQ